MQIYFGWQNNKFNSRQRISHEIARRVNESDKNSELLKINSNNIPGK